MAVIDTMLALTTSSYWTHELRIMTTKDFAEFLAAQMVDNELDGEITWPTRRSRFLTDATAAAEEAAEDAARHPLISIGKYDSGMLVQLTCVMFRKKATAICDGDGCRKVSVCQTPKRPCYADHCCGKGPGSKKAGSPNGNS